ncbi:uncharacterized protein K444DRAFT_623657 [Hyaloscypha bicolor E]|uniref:Uncharacterized protein n=1 Tax=Hyaloscypha bicolor E TaxID=1095630 RepID=A0A2J6TWZ2_9HELO|nr:uncharacterized protein K444DRAFT_623657 [Hyaloscypha bicolor E]PMD67501.1 hypothetical protein K444DRAFT_623657 [Hyaloscypha bicolor E]
MNHLKALIRCCPIPISLVFSSWQIPSLRLIIVPTIDKFGQEWKGNTEAYQIGKSPRSLILTLIWLDYHDNSPTPSAGPEHQQESQKETESTRSDIELVQNKPETTSENPPKSNLPPSDDEQPPDRYHKILQDALCIRFHTMQVPYLNTPNVRMALVHHVDIPQAVTGFGKPEEKIFAFVLGLKGIDIGMEKLLDALKLYWEATDEQRAAKEVAAEKVGLTPKLFIAAILKLYGFRAAKKSILVSAYDRLLSIDTNLVAAEKLLFLDVTSKKPLTEREQRGKLAIQVKTCTKLNQTLMDINMSLPGVRSRVHYIGLCARGLVRDQSTMQAYIKDKLIATKCDSSTQAKVTRDIQPARIGGHDIEKMVTEETRPSVPLQGEQTSRYKTIGDRGMSLDEALSELGTTKFHRRDNDKLDMIERAMEQFEVDIKSLKARTTIAIGLVSNLYAHSQGNFQSLMLQAAERDSSNMRTIATLTVLLLPATFLTVLFATPIIQWAVPVVKIASGSGSDSSDSPINHIDRGFPILALFPFSLYMGLSLSTNLPLLLYLRWEWFLKKWERAVRTKCKHVQDDSTYRAERERESDIMKVMHHTKTQLEEDGMWGMCGGEGGGRQSSVAMSSIGRSSSSSNH